MAAVGLIMQDAVSISPYATIGRTFAVGLSTLADRLKLGLKARARSPLIKVTGMTWSVRSNYAGKRWSDRLNKYHWNRKGAVRSGAPNKREVDLSRANIARTDKCALTLG